ncbi:LUL3 [Symbiodinium natans]|uniref:LUL3 protein n=1 Tax=Symbiodinium natans TaxID=878477 RepID=A0A812IAR7_9DINO|nr:LUL3 [Symbiodinium natans]
MAMVLFVRLLLLALLALADALPSSVVVHGRQGRNSNINGVYIRDYAWRNGLCWRRAGHAGSGQVFLYFDGEWRMGPSPEDGSVWAFARSLSSSPLLIDQPWQVWDGQRVVQDPRLQVSDTSLVPQVLLLSFGEGSPLELGPLQGMLMQQPGLWDGRPYYKHMQQELFLLCSPAEGWRLGPLPLGDPPPRPVLFSRSAAALPQEIVEPWMVPSLGPGGADQLPAASVRLAPMDFGPPQRRNPRHLLVEGVVAGNGSANGVYRLAPDSWNLKPVYHKTDAIRTASLWFAAGDWRIGPSIEDGRVWVYATADMPSHGDARWFSFAGVVEEVRVVDAATAIPTSISVDGTEFVQDSRLCDARPVYAATSFEAGNSSGSAMKVYLYFRAQESEWWLGPEVGGPECFARAAGSLLSVLPGSLHWTQPRSSEVSEAEAEDIDTGGGFRVRAPELDLGDFPDFGDPAPAPKATVPPWLPLVCSVATAAAWFLLLRPVSGKEASAVQKPSKPEALACVVCLEAPRKILLMPCRHVCCCKDCAERLERCPVCRTETTSLAEVFL